MALIQCPECGKEVSDQAVACPHCGYNLKKEFSVAITENSKSKIRLGIVAVFIIIVVVAISLYVIRKRQTVSRSEYLDNLALIHNEMLMTAADAESMANLIRSVWYNTIYEKSDRATNKYTIKPYKYSEDRAYYSGDDFNSDFNTSINSLFLDLETLSKIDEIKAGCVVVADLYGKLQNPPSDLTACYTTMNDMYDAFQDLTRCATNPSGNYSSFTSEFKTADSDFMDAYTKLDAMLMNG